MSSEYSDILNRLMISKDDKLLLNNNLSDTSELYAEKFDHQIINIKIFFILLLAIASGVNKDTDFINKNPSKFATECVMYGVVASLPFIYMEYQRKNKDKKFLALFLICFIVIVLCHVLLQVGGFYTLMYTEKDNSMVVNDPSNYNKLYDGVENSTIYTIVLIMCFMIVYLFITAYKVGNFNVANYKTDFNLMFSTETIIFALCNALPFMYIAYNRQPHATPEQDKKSKHENIFETSLLFVKFVVLHLLLQASDFYKHTFGWN